MSALRDVDSLSTEAEAPNPVDSTSRQDAVVALSVVMVLLSSSAVAVRFYTRRILLRFLAADDWTILVALVCRILSQ